MLKYLLPALLSLLLLFRVAIAEADKGDGGVFLDAFRDPVTDMHDPYARFAPRWMVYRCNSPPNAHHMLIFAQTTRPEGTYVIVGGTVWVTPDSLKPMPAYVDWDEGEIYLLAKSGRMRSCRFITTTDDAYPPSQVPFNQSILKELSLNLIRDEAKAYGGPLKYRAAMQQAGQWDGAYPLVISLINALCAKAMQTPGQGNSSKSR